MLNKQLLTDKIRESLEEILCPTFETALLEFIPTKSKDGDEKCAKFKECLKENLCGPLATALASAIDMYIKQISIHGIILTQGSPFTQTAVINSGNIPMINGIMPNTLGIR
ncbi:MAG: hypothetical protein J1F35_06010 [Erysipelotrichales bacterium]|nr:hypothetical protein [Erysipelotrichales bacterium]